MLKSFDSLDLDRIIKLQYEFNLNDRQTVVKYLDDKDPLVLQIYKFYKLYNERSSGNIKSITINEDSVDVKHTEGSMMWVTKIPLDSTELKNKLKKYERLFT